MFTFFSGLNVGFHTDEMDMNNYAKANVNYYLSGGKDLSYLGVPNDDETKVESILRYYGSAFEYFPVLFNKVTGLENSPQEFNVRHTFINIFAILALLFTGLLARKLGGWVTALFAIWLIYLTPAFFGAALFNSKDVPFCTGYAATMYFIVQYLERLPKPDWKTTLWLMASFAFTTGVRIGGLLLLGSFFLFLVVYAFSTQGLFKAIMDNFRQVFLQLVTIVFGGVLLVVFMWPYVLSNPSENLTETLTVVKKFPMIIPMIFEGEFTNSLNIPNYYLPKFFSITIPVFVLGTVVAGTLLFVTQWKRQYWQLGAFILFTCVFPVAYAIYSQVALYSQWRHFLFIFPGLGIMAAWGLAWLTNKLQAPAAKGGVVAVCCVAMAHPVMWMAKNHPYEYCYFNEVSGGYKKMYYEFETDYWKISMTNGFNWLMAHEPIARSADSVTIATDMDMFLKYYVKRHYPGAKVRVLRSDVTNRYGQDWTYAVFTKQFVEPHFLKNFFPPSETIYSELVDGMPETVILKDTARLDLAARNAFMAQKYPLSDSLLTAYFKFAPNNTGLYGVMALVKSYENKNDECLKYGNLALVNSVNDFSVYNALCGMGVAYSNLHRYDSAMEKLKLAQQRLPDNALAPNLMKAVAQMQQQQR
ncbi:MAG: hypothetical protein EBZ77_10280 [Chitinophagia bacterium]|nr:hypothetical protein [Chitinophagia bacterium]